MRSYKKHIGAIASGLALGSAGVTMMAVLSGCNNEQKQEQEQVAQNKFLVIEQQADGKYIVIEEMPTEGPTRAMIREKDENGTITERIMSEAEMKELAAQEYKKVEDGSSETIQGEHSSPGMGLAGTILAAAGGALLGNMIGNALMNNKNFASRSQAVNQSAYSRSNRPASSSTAGASSQKKSFFGGSSGSSHSSSSSYGG